MIWGSKPFTDPLKKAYAEGKLPNERLSDLVRRILRSAYADGIDKWGPAPEVDMAKHNEIALEIARQGIVLLKNDGALPLATDKKLKIAVIGGYAQQGVISGTGSGAVAPVGNFAGVIKIGGAGVMGKHRNVFLFPPSPLEELKKQFPKAEFDFEARSQVIFGNEPCLRSFTSNLGRDVSLRSIASHASAFPSITWERVRTSMNEYEKHS
ncbi:MAG: glycoside hydrolase family 3 C-terminal domain-containing protein [bacterium]